MKSKNEKRQSKGGTEMKASQPGAGENTLWRLALRRSLNRMWRQFLVDDPDTQISGVVCPAPGHNKWDRDNG